MPNHSDNWHLYGKQFGSSVAYDHVRTCFDLCIYPIISFLYMKTVTDRQWKYSSDVEEFFVEDETVLSS